MSYILIKGAEKPDHCLLCFAFRDGICAVAKKEVVLSKGVQEWCPLVEIPPHGRLIDADKLLERIKRDLDTACIFDDEEAAYQSAVEDAEFIIDCAPTVIEREEE